MNKPDLTHWTPPTDPADILPAYCPQCRQPRLCIHHPDWINEHLNEPCRFCGNAVLSQFTLGPKP